MDIFQNTSKEKLIFFHHQFTEHLNIRLQINDSVVEFDILYLFEKNVVLQVFSMYVKFTSVTVVIVYIIVRMF